LRVACSKVAESSRNCRLKRWNVWSDLIAVPARKAMQQRQTFKASASQWQRDLLIEFDVLAEAEKAARQADPRVVAFRKIPCCWRPSFRFWLGSIVALPFSAVVAHKKG
jgi:hypothetical protein